jgi:hypothetical protein
VALGLCRRRISHQTEGPATTEGKHQCVLVSYALGCVAGVARTGRCHQCAKLLARGSHNSQCAKASCFSFLHASVRGSSTSHMACEALDACRLSSSRDSYTHPWGFVLLRLWCGVARVLRLMVGRVCLSIVTTAYHSKLKGFCALSAALEGLRVNVTFSLWTFWIQISGCVS